MSWKLIDWIFGTGKGTDNNGKEVDIREIMMAAAEL